MGKEPCERSLAQAVSQPDFVVNIILLIRRDVKRNPLTSLTLLWKNLPGGECATALPKGSGQQKRSLWWIIQSLVFRLARGVRQPEVPSR
jgi:hypothetical protein